MKHMILTERRYPLTESGFYTNALSVTADIHWEHCVLDVTAYRGCALGISAICGGDARCVLTDGEGAVLGSWQEVPAELTIPATAARLYLSNHHTEHPNFFLTVPARPEKGPGHLLFYHDFTGGKRPDPNDFLNARRPGSAVPGHGLLLAPGMENALVVYKYIAADDWTLTAELTAPTLTETVYLGTRPSPSRICRHGTLCSVDFAAGVLRLHPGNTGETLPERDIQTADILPILREGDHDYTLRLERVNVAIRATLTNDATGQQVSLYEGLVQEETETTIAGSCRAGKMYDLPQFFVTAGAPLLRRLYAAAKTTPKVMFFGDSLTQGAHNLPEDGWAQLSAAHIGNSLCCGRGSGDIWSCLNQVRSMVPLCRPKAMVITIGANNKPGFPASLYEKLLHMAAYWGVIPIVNCIPACDQRPQERIMNGYLRQLPCLKSRFDLVTRTEHTPDSPQNMSFNAADGCHLNREGNRALYQRFVSDFGWLKDL